MIISELQIKTDEEINSTVSSEQCRNNLIISEVKLDSGEYHVLSRYGDAVWKLPFTMFPTVQPPSRRKIRFHLIPKCFQETAKSAIYRYKREGREGYAKPRGDTIIHAFYYFVPFFNYLSEIGVITLSEITPMICMNYVNHQKKHKKRNGKKLATNTLFQQLAIVELLHEMSQDSNDIMSHPWPDSSAKLLAGATGSHAKEGKTKIIPEKILTSLFNEAVGVLGQKEVLLTVRDELARIAKLHCHLCITQIWFKQTTWLKQQGYTASLRQQTKKCDELRDACMIIVLTLSGCRAHELAYMNNGSVYSSEDDKGNRYLWMRSTSTKTYTGTTEWMIPKLVKQALDVAELWVKPLQQKIQDNITQQLFNNSNCPKAQEQKSHQTALFLGHCRATDTVSTLSGSAVNDAINRFAKERNINWHFTEHQFRRTFAVAVARSAYGDLRYLREHFKHWSMDMTALYAINEKQEEKLYNEIMIAIQNEKIAVVEHWLDDDALITGGGAQGIITFRKKNHVKTYQDRRTLANNISGLVHIRATGHGWCLADEGGCDDKGLVNKTCCVDCRNNVIDNRHVHIWRGIHAQQMEVIHLDDIGESGKMRAKRDLERCESILKDLGVLDKSNKNIDEATSI